MKRQTRIVLMTFVMVLALAATCYAASAKKPVITVSSQARDSIVVKSRNNTGINGYQIKYATKSNMSGAKTKYVMSKGTLNRSISGLKASTKYYVRARAYVIVNGKKSYSEWSAKKACSTKSYTVAYVNLIKLNLETSKDSTNKWKTEPDSFIAPYMAEVKVYGSTGSYAKDQWVKLSYKGNIRYTWIDIDKGKVPFTKVKHVFTYENYEKYCKNDYQRKILMSALDFYNDVKTLKYSKVNDPSVGFDCSGFTRYMYQLAGLHRLPAKPEAQYQSTDIKIKVSDLQPGDLIFFDDRDDGGIDHAGIYIGNGEFIQSAGQIPSGTDGMSIRPLTGKYLERFEGGGRFSRYSN